MKPPLFDAPPRECETTPPPPCDCTRKVEAFWTDVVAALDVSAASRDSWIDPLHLLGHADGVICVIAEPRIADWTARRYGAVLEAAVCERGGRGVRIFAAPEERNR